jgi:hypothetical protein
MPTTATTEERGRPGLCDQRGSSFVQTIILLSAVALAAMFGFRELGAGTSKQARCAGDAIANLGAGRCADGDDGAGGAGGGPLPGPPPAAPVANAAEIEGADGPQLDQPESLATLGAGAGGDGQGPFGADMAGRDPRAEDLDMAKLSKDAYNERSGGDLNGWRRLSNEELAALGIDPSDLDGRRPLRPGEMMMADPGGDGFRAAVYVKDGRYVVAFAGTDPTQPGDIATDVGQAVGLGTSQYVKAQALGRQISGRLGGNVVFTGHSLGGGLAAHAALSTGGTAVTFNAAGLSDNSIRSAGLDPAAARQAADSGQVRAYANHNDPLTGAQERDIPFQPGIGLPGRSIEVPDAVGHPIEISGDGHGIDNVISGLERDQPWNR